MGSRFVSRRLGGFLVSIMVLAALLVPASAALAAGATCTFDTNYLLIVVEQDDVVVEVVRDGTALVAYLDDAPLACTDITNPGPSAPTTLNTTEIEIDVAGEGADGVGSDDQVVVINLSEGPIFGFNIDLGETGNNWDVVDVLGSSGADNFVVGSSPSPSSVLDIDDDRTADATIDGEEWIFLSGGAGADELSGEGFLLDINNNLMSYGDGGEELTLHGGEGSDVLTGSPLSTSYDTIDYFDSDSDNWAGEFYISVALPSGTTPTVGAGGDAQGDSIKWIENIIGSPWQDELTGNAGANDIWGNGGGDRIKGLDGDDFLFGGDGFDQIEGGAGADEMDGGNISDDCDPESDPWGCTYDDDTLWYMESDAAVAVDLSDPTPVGGHATGDVIVTQDDGLSTFEGVRGSNHADTLTGDERHNRLEGMGGNDTMTGLAGDDQLTGVDGDDDLFGGTGSDMFYQLDGPDGADDLHGGDGFDIAEYQDRSTSTVQLDADGVADDGDSAANGGAGERDNIHTDVEAINKPQIGWDDCSGVVTQECVLDFTIAGAAPPSGVGLHTYVQHFIDDNKRWLFSELDISVTYDDGDPNDGDDNDVMAAPGWPGADAEVQIELNVGDFDPTALFSQGDVKVLSYTHSDTTGNTVTLSLVPKPISWTHDYCVAGDWCGDDTTQANDDFSGVAHGFFVDIRSRTDVSQATMDETADFVAGFRGAWIATSAQSWTFPFFNEESGELEFDLASPHLKADGVTQNRGFFKAFLSDAFLEEKFGITDPGSVTSASFEVTRTDGSSTTDVTPTVERGTGVDIDGSPVSGVTITVEDIGFSTPGFAIAKAVPATPPPSTDTGGQVPPPSPTPTPTSSATPAPGVTAPPSGGTIEGDNKDILVGSGGEPVEVVGDGNTVTVEGDRDVTITGENNTVTLEGSDNTLRISGDANQIDGSGAGASIVGVEGSDNTITLGSENDELTLSGSGNTADLGSGDDTAAVSGGTVASSVADAALANVVKGQGGADRLTSLGSSDHLLGGAGTDVLTGGAGSDRLAGGSGIDALAGGSGPDQLFGNDGADVLRGQAGADELRGGAGRDQLHRDRKDTVVKGGPGRDTIM